MNKQNCGKKSIKLFNMFLIEVSSLKYSKNVNAHSACLFIIKKLLIIANGSSEI